MFLLEKLLCFLILVVPILISVAYLTLAERKVMGSMQQRKGPNVIGFLGLLQPLADGLKLLIKETVIPTNANTFSFVFAPVLTLFLSLFGWSLIPFSSNSFYVDIDLSLLFIFAVSSLGVYGIILSGWSSNSRYAFFGSLRSASQMVSYEVSIGLILIIVLVCVGSLNFFSIVLFQEFLFFLVPLFPIFFMFLVSILAETNRAPFDLPEAESELVSGYNVEYASMGFALFFLAEYSSMILMSALTTIVFIGGWISVFSKPFILDSFILAFKLSIILFFFIWVRASFPRYRIDQLMRLCWKVFLPISLSFVLVTFSLLWCFNGVL
uniref:NADH-ubiquinone oxidoreductase chain 1 n=1 Tax=Phaeocystis globosa TaxID=33658 RepID=A0A8A1RXN6_9EUKA|nr:NADH dehydrogenase subunit 1 [Phaeocystis globosa]QST19729.1 NADH dehydrogenase subunit 1 [Phaeocystis globosa]